MAIKKGVFELYTQERKLPDKKTGGQGKKNHFFDDIYKNEVSSQLVHNWFTIDEPNSINNSDKKINLELENQCNDTYVSSQCDSEITINGITSPKDWLQKGEIKNNGSQSVHSRFTNFSEVIDLSSNEKQKVKSNEQRLTTSFSRLIGNQREVVIALYKNMRVNKTTITEELTLKMISNLTRVNQKSLKNTLFRMINTGVINRVDQKIGRGGWVKYQINSVIFNEMQQNEFLILSKTKK